MGHRGAGSEFGEGGRQGGAGGGGHLAHTGDRTHGSEGRVVGVGATGFSCSRSTESSLRSRRQQRSGDLLGEGGQGRRGASAGGGVV